MKETGIVMTGDHPAKILAGTKTMTRRVIKPQPKDDITEHWTGNWCSGIKGDSYEKIHICPYGQVGDRLWVRETWAVDRQYNNAKPSRIPVDTEIIYKNDLDLAFAGKWRSSRFMPKWASRITLEITGVRVERLQEITDRDCEKEGLDNPCGYYCDEAVGHVDHQGTINNFSKLWDSLNAKRGYGWEVNPWVWVISFKVLNDNRNPND